MSRGVREKKERREREERKKNDETLGVQYSREWRNKKKFKKIKNGSIRNEIKIMVKIEIQRSLQ